MLATVPVPSTIQETTAPVKYLIVQRAQRCTCCGSHHEWSELYSWNPLPARIGMGKIATHLRSIFWPKYRLPVEKIPLRKVDRIPFCHECHQPSLEHSFELLDPPPVPAKLYAVVSGAQEVRSTPSVAPVKSGVAKPKASISDLEALL